MTIYTRTALGNEVALNRESPLPRKLRTLLIAIDGITRLSTYTNTLSSFGDVEALLESLLQAGLIRVLPESAPAGASAGNDSSAKLFSSPPHPGWSNTEPGGSSQNSRSNAPNSRSSSGMGEPVNELLSWSKFQSQPQAAPRAPSFAPASSRAAPTAHYQLRGAIALMSDFVSSHLPADALEVVLALESLSSVEEVLGSLKGYESLIAPVGEPARKHLAELRTLMSSF